jgi:glycosyltransferase involved in cell wall biosynthesis
MISTHPTSEGGVASYTRNLVQALREHGVNVVIFSNKPRNENVKQSYEGVYSVWNKGILYPFQIFKALVTNSNVDIIHIQHEFFLYGDMFSALLFPVLLILVRLLGKPVVVTMHGVIPLSELNKRFKRENELNGPLFLLKFALIFITKVIVFLSDAVIVHGKFFAKVMYNDYKCPKQKIHIIPLGIEEAKIIIPQNEAKRRLGLENKVVILFFGYIARYKGVEMLIDAFGRLARKYQEWVLIIGGGHHPRLRLNPKYKEYITKLQQMAHQLAPEKVLFTGFIPDEELPLYLSAADIIVFPYTTAMSSSAALTSSMSYEKPIIASNIPPMKELIPFEEALFERGSPEDLAKKLESVLNNSNLRHKISIHFKKVCEKNSWSNVGLQTYILYQSKV